METKGKFLFWENGVESKVVIAFGTYQRGGRLSASLYRCTEDGSFTDLYDVITVNFVESQLLPVGAQFIDENNHPGIGKWLEKNGIARPLDIWIRSGFCRYPAYEFNLNRVKS